MARVKKSKSEDVQKFGGTETLGNVRMSSGTSTQQFDHQIDSIEAQSKTTLQMDEGHGDAAIIRCFTFGINPEAFKQHQPTRQELFNAHYKGIETALWKDGLQVNPYVNPRLVFNQSKGSYQIFVGAKPMKGFILNDRPQTLNEIANG